MPPGVSPAEAAVATDAVATAYHALHRRAQVKKEETVFLFGLGGLGFNALQILLSIGARIIVSDLRNNLIEDAEALGVPAEDIVPNGHTVQDFVSERGLSGKIDTVLDFVGTHQTFEDAQQIGKSTWPRAQLRSLRGSRCRTNIKIQFVEEGKLCALEHLTQKMLCI